PHYIILKPTLVGGLYESRNWIQLAKENKVGWWITSALESNIGLNAICQLADLYQPSLPQGLGTGGLYHNNIDSPLTLQGEYISYDPQKAWGTIF
ncbi:MAG: o-succinylbenzoate synthase, partial [Bacteroidota bacterium]